MNRLLYQENYVGESSVSIETGILTAQRDRTKIGTGRTALEALSNARSDLAARLVDLNLDIERLKTKPVLPENRVIKEGTIRKQ